MKIYPDYKSIDQLWLEEIPGEWQTIKIKYAFEERSEKGYPDEPLLVASQNMGVVPKSLYGNRTVEAQKDIHLLKLVRIGDFVISLRSFQGGIEYAYYQGIISPAYTIMVSKGILTSGYFRYLAKSHSFIELLKSCVTGIREGQNIDYSKLKNYRIPVPPRPEQDQIVRFLDWKVSSINKLISIKKKQIVLLKEQENQSISHIVLRGFHSSLLKDSGNQWVGDIPIDWNVIKLGRFCSFQNGISESGEFFTSGTPFVGYGDVYRHLELPETVRGVAQSNEQQQEAFSVRKGDIFFTRTSENIEEIGMAAVCKHTIEKAIFSGFVIRCRPRKALVDIEYMKFYLQIPAIRNHFSSMVNIVIRASLGQNLLKQMPVIIPPITEQKEIATHLDTQHSKYTVLIETIQKEIQALDELKTRLISDVVTGKIDVRGIEIPEYEFVGNDIGKESDENAETMEGETYEE